MLHTQSHALQRRKRTFNGASYTVILTHHYGRSISNHTPATPRRDKQAHAARKAAAPQKTLHSALHTQNPGLNQYKRIFTGANLRPAHPLPFSRLHHHSHATKAILWLSLALPLG